MNKNKQLAVSFAIALILGLFGYAGAGVNPGQDQWMRCCQTNNKTGEKCSDARSYTECVMACQRGCGDPDSLEGKKCRQFCRLKWPGGSGGYPI